MLKKLVKKNDKLFKRFQNTIVKAKIHPAIGVARVGNSEEFFLGPETIYDEKNRDFKEATDKTKIKRQAQRFRLYGYDADDNVVQEITTDDTDYTIKWNVKIANKKAGWFNFEKAMDIEAAPDFVTRRNANFTGLRRKQLDIEPPAVEIEGAEVGGTDYEFNGKFINDTDVYLGELKTDEKGRLIFLGGKGKSASPYNANTPVTFANNDGWYDDVSDGPVDATLIKDGTAIPVISSWVFTGPPNYGSSLEGPTNLYDLVLDTVRGAMVTPARDQLEADTLFRRFIYPIFVGLCDGQWTNKGLATYFGHGAPYNLTSAEWLAKLTNPSAQFAETRNAIFRMFRDPAVWDAGTSGEPGTSNQQLWPQFYGDNVTEHYFTVTKTQYAALKQWKDGDFITPSDAWLADPEADEFHPSFDSLSEEDQVYSLDRSALHYCLGGPFHPGCEVTWPIRHASMYYEPFRIRKRGQNEPVTDFGDKLEKSMFQGRSSGSIAISSAAPLYAQGAGDLTRWMAIPWQTDTASCRSGYTASYDPYLPTFWVPRVPNQVLSMEQYRTVMNPNLPKEERIASFMQREGWLRDLKQPNDPVEYYINEVSNMINEFGDLGVVAKRPGVDDPNIPELPKTMFVETEFVDEVPTNTKSTDEPSCH